MSQNGQEGKENVNTFAYRIQRKVECPRHCVFFTFVSFDLIKEIYSINLAGLVYIFAQSQLQHDRYALHKSYKEHLATPFWVHNELNLLKEN